MKGLIIAELGVRKMKTESEEIKVPDDGELLTGLCNLYSEAEDYFQENRDLLDDLKKIDKPYSERSLLDQGGMKTIYTCKDLRSDRLVAIAELKDVSNHQKLNDFLREAKITAYLQHPNIVPVYEIGLNEQEIPFFSMKLIKGKTLGEIIKGLKNRDPEFTQKYTLSRLIDIFEKVCEGIAYAHSRGVLHLDIKPDNISVSDYGEVLICDWGISELCPEAFDDEAIVEKEFKSLLPLLRKDKMIRGTIPYICPEQIDKNLGQASPVSDIYSLGILFYNILTWEIPFKHTEQKDEFIAVLKGDILPPSEKCPDKQIPKSLEAVCMKSIEFTPSDRYQSVNEILTEIQRFKDGYATEAEEASAFELLSLLFKRNKQTCIALLVALFVIIIIISVSIIGIRNSEQIAIEERNKALAAKNETMKTVNDLKSEKIAKLAMASKAADRYLRSAKQTLYFNNYEKNKELMAVVWQLGSHDEDIQTYFAYHCASILDFERAEKVFRQLPEHQSALTLIKLIREQVLLSDILKFAEMVQKQTSDRGLKRYFLRNAQDLNLSLEDKVQILKAEIIASNNSKVNFKHKVVEDHIELDLSDNTFSSSGSLDKLNIKKLVMRNTSLNRERYLPWSTLEYLDISNSTIKQIHTAPNLKFLKMQNSQLKLFSHFEFLKKLEYLDMRGASSLSNKLLRLKNLKEVIMSPNLKNSDFEKKAHFKITYK